MIMLFVRGLRARGTMRMRLSIAATHEVLLQMPAVAQDTFGEIHVRGEHASAMCNSESMPLQCAIQNQSVELPEGLSVFGQALETRFTRSFRSLPARCD